MMASASSSSPAWASSSSTSSGSVISNRARSTRRCIPLEQWSARRSTGAAEADLAEHLRWPRAIDAATGAHISRFSRRVSSGYRPGIMPGPSDLGGPIDSGSERGAEDGPRPSSVLEGGQHRQQGRFPGAVRARHANHASRIQPEGDVDQHRNRCQCHFHAIEFHERLGPWPGSVGTRVVARSARLAPYRSRRCTIRPATVQRPPDALGAAERLRCRGSLGGRQR